jgi:hypothetical protein
MAGVIIVKGHGVFTSDVFQNLFGQGMKRAFSPHEIDEMHGRQEDGSHVNPLHVNPYTGEKLQNDSRFRIKDRFTAIVDEWSRKIRKAKEEKGLPVDEEEIKKALRMKLNESAVVFNSFKEDGDIHKYPVLFTDVDKGTVNPKLITGARAPRYQKHARTRIGNDWRPEGEEFHPRDMKIMNDANQITHVTSSRVMHKNHGHMTEAEIYHGYNIADALIRDAVQDPNDQTLYIPNVDLDDLRPGALSGGVVEPQALVKILTEDGDEKDAFRRSRTQFPFNDGTQPRTVFEHGSHGYLDAFFSLHPAFFTPIAGAQDRSGQRKDSARALLSMGGATPDENVVDALARTPAIYLFAKHFPFRDNQGKSRKGGSAFSSNTDARALLHQMKRALGVPHTRGIMGEEEQSNFHHYNHNSGNFGINRRISDQVQMKEHAPSNIKDALAASIMLMQDTPESRTAATNFRDIRGVANFSDGEFYKDQLLRRYPGVRPIDPNSIRWITKEQIKKDVHMPASPFHKVIPYAGEAERGTGNPGYAGLEVANIPSEDDDVQTSVDTLFDVMENLQSADARMDTLIIKSLPARRRFNLSDSYDVLSLCETFSLEKRDLHYIDQTMGDWGKIAQNLKVKPDVVKAVKVALRW